jgi:DNA-binding IclR family transcriptional regulator
MKNLRDKVNECVQLVVRDGNEAIYVEKIEGDRPVRVYTRVGRYAPLYGGACPRAILSFMEDEEIERILKAQQLEAITSNTIINKLNLLKSIEEARKTGYTVSFGELQLESAAVGAPIFDSQGKVIASISIAGPEFRFTDKEMTFLIEELLKTTFQISQKFSYKKPQVT